MLTIDLNSYLSHEDLKQNTRHMGRESCRKANFP